MMALLLSIILGSLNINASQDPQNTLGPSCQKARTDSIDTFKKTYAGNHAFIKIQTPTKNWIEESQTGANSDSKFLLASVSKTLSALATMKLVESGRLALTQTVDDLSVHDDQIPAPWRNVTLRSLLGHTSGIRDYMNRDTDAEQAQTDIFLRAPHTIYELFNSIPSSLAFEPKTRLKYSNTGYLMIAHLIERQTHLAHADFLKTELTSPVGMDSTFVATKKEDGFYGDSSLDLGNMVGVGTTVSTTNDLMRALDALLSQSILKQSTLDTMFAPDPECHGDSCERYGIGFSLRNLSKTTTPNGPSYRWILHQGHLRTVSNIIAAIPSLGFKIVILSDGSDINGETVAQKIMQSWIDNCVM